VKEWKLSILRDLVHNGPDQRGGIASSTVVWVRANGTYFSIAWDRGTLTRHGDQATFVTNAKVTPELNRVAPEGAGFRKSGEGDHFVNIILTQFLDFYIGQCQASERFAQHLLDWKLCDSLKSAARLPWLLQEENTVIARGNHRFERNPTFRRLLRDSCERRNAFRIPLREVISLRKVRVKRRKGMPDRIGKKVCHSGESITECGQSCRELREYLWRHLRREFLEQTHRALRKPVAEMNQP
jgi:hypothetical protein